MNSKPKSHRLWRTLLHTCLIVFSIGFVLGFVEALDEYPDYEVFLTGQIGYSPNAHPYLHGFVYGTVSALLLVLTPLLAGAIVMKSIKGGTFHILAGGIFSLGSLLTFVLALFGPSIGIELETGQRVTFGFMTVFAGFFGVLVLSPRLQKAISSRIKKKKKKRQSKAAK